MNVRLLQHLCRGFRILVQNCPLLFLREGALVWSPDGGQHPAPPLQCTEGPVSPHPWCLLTVNSEFQVDRYLLRDLYINIGRKLKCILVLSRGCVSYTKLDRRRRQCCCSPGRCGDPPSLSRGPLTPTPWNFQVIGNPGPWQLKWPWGGCEVTSVQLIASCGCEPLY